MSFSIWKNLDFTSRQTETKKEWIIDKRVQDGNKPITGRTSDSNRGFSTCALDTSDNSPIATFSNANIFKSFQIENAILTIRNQSYNCVIKNKMSDRKKFEQSNENDERNTS